MLQHGWAYGSQGKALEGKYILQALSGGGDASTYQKDGFNMFTIGELTSPFRATAKLCKMTWLPPFTVLGIHKGLPDEILNAHTEDYRSIVIALRDGNLDIDHARQEQFINSALNFAIKRP